MDIATRQDRCRQGRGYRGHSAGPGSAALQMHTRPPGLFSPRYLLRTHGTSTTRGLHCCDIGLSERRPLRNKRECMIESFDLTGRGPLGNEFRVPVDQLEGLNESFDFTGRGLARQGAGPAIRSNARSSRSISLAGARSEIVASSWSSRSMIWRKIDSRKAILSFLELRVIRQLHFARHHRRARTASI